MRSIPRNNGWLSGIVPYGVDQAVCLVIDSFGAGGTVYRDTEIENADLETMSADIAAEIRMRCDMDGAPVPDHLTDFVELTRRQPTRQLALRLRVGDISFLKFL